MRDGEDGVAAALLDAGVPGDARNARAGKLLVHEACEGIRRRKLGGGGSQTHTILTSPNPCDVEPHPYSRSPPREVSATGLSINWCVRYPLTQVKGGRKVRGHPKSTPGISPPKRSRV